VRETIKRHLLGRTCNSLVVYEAHGPTGLIDAVPMIVLGVDLADSKRQWVRVFFDLGGWSLTVGNEPVPPPEDPAGELRFPVRDVAAALLPPFVSRSWSEIVASTVLALGPFGACALPKRIMSDADEDGLRALIREHSPDRGAHLARAARDSAPTT